MCLLVEAWCAPIGVTHSLINRYIRFACKSAGKEELPDDDTHVSKHVGAVEFICVYVCCVFVVLSVLMFFL
jgi:hypothetical protein